MYQFIKCLCLTLALSVLSLPANSQESVNINSDSIKLLAKGLDGVGVRRAVAIVKHRKENGHFESIDDLAKVKGVSMSLVEKNRDRIILKMPESE
ncbi:MAG: helix-hairpin-helix domain-containing protein [Gammaproteobacteria bacterium]|nr:helix-hairpin-helix domain-containing protein [Pseudomonadota bacterium]MCH9662451.1 helix-hairpin-helix domain-containing protein [Gammaproteobacteria bacterium]